MAKARRKRKAKAIGGTGADALVNEFAARHGRYEDSKVVDLDGSLGGKRMSIVKVVLNRGGTAVDRWIAAEERRRDHSQPRLFEEPQQAAIRYCRNLWHRADGGLRAVDPTTDRVDAPLGWSQHEALAELDSLKRGMPRTYWDVYENVCRFDEEAGFAGSRLATNARSAIDAAKITVAFTASLISMRLLF